MKAGRREDMRELIVLAQKPLYMLQNELARFLGVSDRTLRRWSVGGVRLDPRTLSKLVTAVYAKDPALAARIAAAHGQVAEAIVRASRPERDPEADRQLLLAVVRETAKRARVTPAVMRAALARAFEVAQSAGLTMEEAHALFAAQGDEG
jgi:hypothetical protein